MTERQRIVRVSNAAVAGESEVLVTLGLGSCVAILLHDPEARVGAMAHILLPEPSGKIAATNKWKFASTAVAPLIQAMMRKGADRDRIVGRLVGGASMFGMHLSQQRLHTGERNVQAARAALESEGIAIEAEEVGREHGRSVYFYPADGRVRVTSYQFEEVVL